MPLLDPKTEEYRMAITIMFSALCFAVIVGLLYHLWYKKLQEQRYDLQGGFLVSTLPFSS